MGAKLNLKDYVGQEHIKPLLLAEIRAAKNGNKTLRHGLLFGPSGLGKTTLARVLAGELGYYFATLSAEECTPKAVQSFMLRRSTVGYSKGGAPIGTTFAKHLVFVDEAHKMPNFEAWYDALQDRQIAHNGGVSWLPMFTFLGATNKPEGLPKPFVDRCPLQYTLRGYSVTEYSAIIRGRFPALSDEIASEIGKRSRNSARLALSFAESVINYGGLEFFEMAGIDGEGLTELDRAYIAALANATSPMGLNTLASILRQEPRTISEVVEPHLLSLGKLEITAKGRVLTDGFRGPLETGSNTDGSQLHLAV